MATFVRKSVLEATDPRIVRIDGEVTPAVLRFGSLVMIMPGFRELHVEAEVLCLVFAEDARASAQLAHDRWGRRGPAPCHRRRGPCLLGCRRPAPFPLRRSRSTLGCATPPDSLRVQLRHRTSVAAALSAGAAWHGSAPFPCQGPLFWRRCSALAQRSNPPPLAPLSSSDVGGVLAAQLHGRSPVFSGGGALGGLCDDRRTIALRRLSSMAPRTHSQSTGPANIARSAQPIARLLRAGPSS